MSPLTSQIEKVGRCEAAFKRKWKVDSCQSWSNGERCHVWSDDHSIIELWDISWWRVRSIGFIRAKKP